MAYQIYTFMFIVATAGFPIAISKMVAESMARNDVRDAQRVFQIAFSFLAVIGFLGSLILFVFARQLAELVGIPDAAIGIRAISPAVFFVSMVSAFRGYFQGKQNMFPTAASEVIEASAKLIVGMILASLFMGLAINGGLGKSVDYITRQIESAHTQTIFASAGAIFGVTIGTVLSFLLLSIIYLYLKRKSTPLVAAGDKLRTRGLILKELILIAIPITIGASVSSLTTLIDMATISKRLIIRPEVFDEYSYMFSEGTKFYEKVVAEGWSGLELYKQQAATLYGMYTGKALTMFNLPLTLVVALGMSVVPAISASLAKSNKDGARNITESTIRIAMLFAAPCAIGMAVMSKEVLHLLFSDYNAQVVLSILSLAIICVAIVSVTNAILQSYGKVYYPVI
ncbi:MAG: polysaccharide biosynthesis protein, partial [Oscillospiraceae bacterium]